MRRWAIAVDVRAALALIGTLTRYLSLAFVVPVAVAAWYDEPVLPFALAALVSVGVGFGLEWLGRGRQEVGVREGFLVVSLTWLIAAGVAALPYLIADEPQYGGLANAYFEGMSGFTTTGASVLTDIAAVDRSLLIWRQFTQWLGGMGIIVLALAVLPRLRVGGRQLFESEAPGPEIGELRTTIRDTARRLWVLYVALSALMVLILAVFAATDLDPEMTPYDAIAHTFATLPTGGFSTRPLGVVEFGAATQWVMVAFMVLAGANFALLYAAIVRTRPAAVARDEEFRLYVGLLAFASLVLFVEVLTEELHAGETAIRHAVFQTVSIMTTTGFASTDYVLWTPLAGVVIVGLMFFGGSAGSTTGSVKVVRHLLIGRILRRELDQTVHPELVSAVRLNGVRVDERTLRAVIVFVLLYVGLFAVGSFALMVDAARVDLELTPFEAIGAAATTLGNVGPGFGFAGPVGSFAPFSDVSKTVMVLLMWLGRLEIIPVVVLCTRSYWRI
jgi:trk system potassium uptake protein TrkH